MFWCVVPLYTVFLQIVLYFGQPIEWVKIQTIEKNIKQYYTSKHPRDLLSNYCSQQIYQWKRESVTFLHVCADLYRKQVSTVQITVQYCCIFVLLFGRYSLHLDNVL